MTIDLIIIIGAFVISWLIFNWLIQIIKASVNTALIIAFIILILQLLFGIGPEDIWNYMINFWQNLGEFFNKK